VNVNEPYRELFVWAVLFGRTKLAMIFWKDCPDQIGSALIASLMCKSLAREAKFAGYHHLADKLNVNAGLVIIFCCTCSSMELGDLSAKFKALRTLFQPNFYSSF